MRIADTTRLSQAIANQSRNATATFKAQVEASTGYRVSRPSDDPASFATSVRQDASISKLEARRGATAMAADDLDLAEGVLANASDLMVQAKEIALQLSNGSMDAAARANAANQIGTIRDALLGIANTKGTKGYLFGGTKTDTPPFDATGTFTGNDQRADVEVADGIVARSNASGAKTFTSAGGVDVFAQLSTLEAALATNNEAGIRNSIDSMTKSHDQIVAGRVDTGTVATRFRSASTIIESSLVTLKDAKAKTVEIDPTTAYSNLVDLQAAYERSLAVTKKILSLSAMNQ